MTGKYTRNGMSLLLMEGLRNMSAISNGLVCEPHHNSAILCKHSLDLKFTHTDPEFESVTGFRAEEVVGTSFYQYFHPLDAPVIQSCLKDLYAKGQVETPAYRFLAKDGSCVWLVTQWTLVRDSTTSTSTIASTVTPAPGVNHHSSHLTSSQSNGYILSIHSVVR